MPVILEGDIRLPDNARLCVYRNDKIELEKNELLTLATVDRNGKKFVTSRQNFTNILKLAFELVIFDASSMFYKNW